MTRLVVRIGRASTLLISGALVALTFVGSVYAVLALESYIARPTERETVVQVAEALQARHNGRPGFVLVNPSESIATWMPKVPTLGTCDDDDDCEDAVELGCSLGCDGNGCGEGDVTEVEQNGCVCGGKCADGIHWYVEVCNNPGC